MKIPWVQNFWDKLWNVQIPEVHAVSVWSSFLPPKQGHYTPHIFYVDSRLIPGVHMELRHFFFGGSPANFLSKIHLESNRSPDGLQLLHLDNMDSTSKHREYEITQQDSIWSPHGLIAFNCVIQFTI